VSAADASRGGFVRLAVLGDPLRYTRSPELHRAGLAATGRAGESMALVTPIARLPQRLGELARAGFRGCNLTMPLKQPALACVARVSERARRARSVNTIGFDGDATWGDTTDGPGFLSWLASLGRSPRGLQVLLLGAGGAARSLAVSLAEAEADVYASARDPDAHAAAWHDLGAVVAWRSPAETDALRRSDVVVNATPLADPNAVLPVAALSDTALVVDLRYEEAPTAWVMAARARGLDAMDGLGLLVHQARLSLELWFEETVPLPPLERAVGWPR